LLAPAVVVAVKHQAQIVKNKEEKKEKKENLARQQSGLVSLLLHYWFLPILLHRTFHAITDASSSPMEANPYNIDRFGDSITFQLQKYELYPSFLISLNSKQKKLKWTEFRLCTRGGVQKRNV
jgi:hypothetical protein